MFDFFSWEFLFSFVHKKHIKYKFYSRNHTYLSKLLFSYNIFLIYSAICFVCFPCIIVLRNIASVCSATKMIYFICGLLLHVFHLQVFFYAKSSQITINHHNLAGIFFKVNLAIYFDFISQQITFNGKTVCFFRNTYFSISFSIESKRK